MSAVCVLHKDSTLCLTGFQTFVTSSPVHLYRPIGSTPRTSQAAPLSKFGHPPLVSKQSAPSMLFQALAVGSAKVNQKLHPLFCDRPLCCPRKQDLVLPPVSALIEKRGPGSQASITNLAGDMLRARYVSEVVPMS